MGLYPLLRPLLFLIPPEMAHDLAIGMLRRGIVPPQRHYASPSLGLSVWVGNFRAPWALLLDLIRTLPHSRDCLRKASVLWKQAQ